MNIYIAGPLFNDTERAFNTRMRDFLNDHGFETYLPQEDGGLLYDMMRDGAGIETAEKQLFDEDIVAIRKCDVVVCILDGRVPDEGMCVELGFAYGLGKTCVGYTTDSRTLDAYGQSLMIKGCLTAIVHSHEDLATYLSGINSPQ